MPYDIRCANCGAFLDPGERCDCEEMENSLMHRRKAAKARKRYEPEPSEQEKLARAWQEFDYK